MQADVAHETAVLAMFRRLDVELGLLGGLVNNAGIVDVVRRVDELSVDCIRRVFDVDVVAPSSARARRCGA